MFRKTRENRKAWWNSLNQEEKSILTSKWENKRDVQNRVELDIPPLTSEEIEMINDNMRQIGMADFIVLPDDYYYQEQLAAELDWIN